MSDICGATGIECIRCNPGGCSFRKRESDNITDKELNELIQEHVHKNNQYDELIFRALIELKTYRDLERLGRL